MNQISPPITPQPIPTNDPHCAHVKPDGTRCNAFKVKGSDYCYWHDPEMAEYRDRSSRKGGKKSQSDAIPGWEDIQIESADDLQEAVQRVFNGVARGDSTPGPRTP